MSWVPPRRGGSWSCWCCGPPAGLRFVLATRHDLRLGLHRLRLEGELAEIRADDLRFSLAEARALFAGGRGAAV